MYYHTWLKFTQYDFSFTQETSEGNKEPLYCASKSAKRHLLKTLVEHSRFQDTSLDKSESSNCFGDWQLMDNPQPESQSKQIPNWIGKRREEEICAVFSPPVTKQADAGELALVRILTTHQPLVNCSGTFSTSLGMMRGDAHQPSLVTGCQELSRKKKSLLYILGSRQTIFLKLSCKIKSLKYHFQSKFSMTEEPLEQKVQRNGFSSVVLLVVLKEMWIVFKDSGCVKH